MKTILVLLLACGTAGAQTVTYGNPADFGPRLVAGAQDCPKYQHRDRQEPDHCWTSCDPAPSPYCRQQCIPSPKAKCVNDLHVVTEAEWQKLQERLAEDERRLMPVCTNDPYGEDVLPCVLLPKKGGK